MGNLKITYTDKVALTDDPTIPRENKATDLDFNELKNVVNNNAENFNAGATIDNNADLFLNVSKNLFNINSCIAGGYSDSGWVASTNYITVQFIKVKPNTKYTLSQFTNTFTTKYTALRIVDFDRNHSFIRRGSALSDYNGLTITTNNDAYFIAIAFYTSGTAVVADLTQGQLEEGETASPYEPYIVPTIYSGGNPILFSGGQNYSIEEQRIGTWIDGKPLYRRVISTTMPTITDGTYTEKNVPLNFSPDMLEVVSNHIDTGNEYQYIPTLDTTGKFTRVSYNRAQSILKIVGNKGAYSEKPVVFTVHYTKTTD